MIFSGKCLGRYQQRKNAESLYQYRFNASERHTFLEICGKDRDYTPEISKRRQLKLKKNRAFFGSKPTQKGGLSFQIAFRTNGHKNRSFEAKIRDFQPLLLPLCPVQ